MPNAEIRDNVLDMEIQANPSSYNSKTNNESYGILVRNYTDDNASPIISNNTIKHAKVGIQAWFTSATINNNTILDLNDNITSSGNCFPFGPCPPLPAYGIKAFNTANGFTITENKVENDLSVYTTSPDANLDVTGIYLANSFNANNVGSKVNCNKVMGTGNGLVFSGTNETSTEVIENSMQDHKYGFVLANSGIVGDVGSAASAGDNEWNGSYLDSETFCDNSNGSFSTLFVRNTLNYNPTVDINFDRNNNSLPVVSKTVTTNPSSLLCNARARRKGGNTAVGTNNVNTLAKQLTTRTRMNHFVSAVDSNITFNQQLLYWQLNNDSIKFTDSTWKPFIDSMKVKSLGNAFGKTRNTNQVSNNFDVNVYSISTIQEKLDSNWLLTLQDSLEVMRLAKLCPNYDGIAVYMARDILLQLGYAAPTNICERIIPSNSKRLRLKATEEINSFAIYPNPTNGDLTINLEVKEEDETRIEIYNSIGIKVNEYLLVKGIQHQINNFSKTSGIYIYRILNHETQLKVGKLILQ